MGRVNYTDSQRQRLYTAEREAFNGTEFNAGHITPDEALELTAKVWNLGTGKPFDTPGVRFSRKKNNGAAHYTPWCHRITYEPDSIKAWVVVHEVAHAVEREGASHGPEFARAYLNLVERTFGFDMRERLGAAFRRHKVRSHGKSTPKKRGTGPKRETKRERANRLAAAAGLRIHDDGAHWWKIDPLEGTEPCEEDKWWIRGLDEVILQIKSRGAK